MRSKVPRVQTLVFGFQVGRGEQRAMAIADQHNEIEINLVEQGELQFQHGADLLKVSVGVTVLFWAAIPHRVIAATPQTRIGWLAIPLAEFLAWDLPRPLVKSLFDGEVMIFDQPGNRPPFERWASDFKSKSVGLTRALKLELEAYLHRLAAGISQRGTHATPLPCGPMKSANHVQKMLHFISQNSAKSIHVKDVARAAGLNPEYAMRLFRRTWGTTLWEFVIRQRLFQAKRLLVLTDAKITDIAFECGFNSASRFYSAFSKYCACSPTIFRRR